MSRKLPVTLKRFEDFINAFPVVYRSEGELQPGFCLNVAHCYHWVFEEGYTEKQLNNDVQNHANLYDWNDSQAFYYANDNMFSHSNEQKGIKGSIGFRNGRPYIKSIHPPIENNKEPFLKKYQIPVEWVMVGFVEVEADSLEEAISKARENRGLPHGEYLQSSYRVQEDFAYEKYGENE